MEFGIDHICDLDPLIEDLSNKEIASKLNIAEHREIRRIELVEQILVCVAVRI